MGRLFSGSAVTVQGREKVPLPQSWRLTLGTALHLNTFLPGPHGREAFDFSGNSVCAARKWEPHCPPPPAPPGLLDKTRGNMYT